jgi:diaminohydroxyphosphoribosylaminopyrimidine deaminase / 5-amino-6-(5-phosphoribosylamino)uracil reductase
MASHDTYMQRCLQLALLGAGKVAPNPMVGAVLVHDNIIIGEGYHKRYGEAHAEVNCINSVSEHNRPLIEKSTIYVSLEPCAHFGKTPPCADLIIANRIPKVVIGCKDNYLEVNGRGIEKLRSAGIEVIEAVLEKEAVELNKRFFTFHQEERPYIILKWAQSNDRKIAMPGFTKIAISNPISNRLVHKWRSEEAAIMVGTNTALYDDPSLTTRLWKGKDPVRILLDKDLRIPESHHLLDKKVKTIIFNNKRHEEEENIVYCKMAVGEFLIPSILKKLHQFKIQSVLVEGGATLLQSFIDEGCWDEARVITNDQLVIGDGIHAPELKGQRVLKTEHYCSDTINYYKQAKATTN